MGSLSPVSISVAVIGAGAIGAKHASLLSASDDFSLVSIVDPTPAGEILASKYECRHFQSVTQLLDSGLNVTAAVIATPNHTHADIARELASAGVHLLIEKPLCTTEADGIALLSHCQKQGVRVCVGHHRRLHQPILAAKRCIDAGLIGTPLGVSGIWTTLKPETYFQGAGSWRATETGGAVLINFIHEIDLLHYLLGPIDRVSANKAPSTRHNEADEGMACTLRFASGAVGSFIVLDNTPSPFSIERGLGENPNFPYTGKDSYRIFGTRGTLSVPDNILYTPESIAAGWRSEISETRLDNHLGNVYEDQLRNFAGVVRGDCAPSCSGEAGLAAVRVSLAIKESMSKGAIPIDLQ